MVLSRTAGYRSALTGFRNNVSFGHVLTNPVVGQFLRRWSMIQSFDVTFKRAGRGWRAWVTQTSGVAALPRETLVFRGRSLASLEERVRAYLARLELEDWITSYDYRSVLTSSQSQLLDEALDAARKAESAERWRVRRAHDAVRALSSTWFSMRDISVLLQESKTSIGHIMREGNLLEEAERRDADVSDAMSALDQDAALRNGPKWYAQSHVDAGLSPGAAIALDIAFEVMPLTDGSPDARAVGDHLPDRFARRYDRDFMARFDVVLDRVFESITQSNLVGVCSSPADEIALAVLIKGARDHVRGLLQMGPAFGSLGDIESLSTFREAMTEDLDVDFLWGHQHDGLEEDTGRMDELGIGKTLRFENWFEPYRPGEH
jgi:hypothetical protein